MLSYSPTELTQYLVMMKNRTHFVQLSKLVALLLLLAVPACEKQSLDTLPPVEVYFSPSGGCTEAVVREIGLAQKTLLVQAYSFTSAPIAAALVEAHKRGVDVQAIFDKSQRTEKYSSADFVLHAGIPIYIDAEHAIAHNKVMVIDGRSVVTGSFNFTKAAEEHNAENLLIIRSPELAKFYASNWNAHLAHAEKYEGRAEPVETPQRANNTNRRTFESSSAYVSSRNSEVFHRANCRSAEKISARNLVHYSTRQEAVAAGKKPCDECRP
jgi:phosphatidylserine/phosphatidylglycerophosphate/cardiolipin synthase-like enzyme